MSALTDSLAWKTLEGHCQNIRLEHMRDLFARDPERFQRFSIRFQDILLDYSKNRISQETISLLCDLAREADLAGWIDKMFHGSKINFTENQNNSNMGLIFLGVHLSVGLGVVGIYIMQI